MPNAPLSAVVLALVMCLAGAAVQAQPPRVADGLAAYDGGDYATAATIWRALAEAGDADAQTALAGLYRQGLGVAADLALARQWYRAAARQGHRAAQLNLGELLANDADSAESRQAAYHWLARAADQGSAWAARRLRALAAAMPAAERARAEQSAADHRWPAIPSSAPSPEGPLP